MSGGGYVSTGHLPPAEVVAKLVAEAHERFLGNDEGANPDIYPALKAAPEGKFGVCLVAADGAVHAAGDCAHDFTIMSVSKAFVFALVCQSLGPEKARAKLGVNATGLPFNAMATIERGDGRSNPMVNPGAIATTSLVPGGTHEQRWKYIHAGLSRFAGRDLDIDQGIYTAAIETNFRNRDIARALQARERIYLEPAEALDLYTRQCSLKVNARDLAIMGATLANGGVNPVTGERVIEADTCRHTLAVMATAGLYENSGDWLYEVGIPAKSGIGGGIVAVSPGKGGLGTFSSKLDGAGNSVRGRLAARFLSERLGLSLFASNSQI